MTKSYYAGVPTCGARVRVLDEVSMQVRVGEVVAVVGAAGSGKTTLIRLANRMLAPDHGVVEAQPARLLLIDEPAALHERRRFAQLQRMLLHACASGVGVLVTSRQALVARVATCVFTLAHGRLWLPMRAPGAGPARARVAERDVPLTALPGSRSIR